MIWQYIKIKEFSLPTLTISQKNKIHCSRFAKSEIEIKEI